jgi:predicted nuclease with RNAse H fold
VTIGFGLDLSGYGKKGGTVLAAALVKNGGVAEISILTNSAFSKTLNGNSSLPEQTEDEQRLLLEIAARRSIAIDVPIDLQNLPSPPNATKVWELTQRPIDRAFKGLAPLADKLGYCVARFLNLLRSNRNFEVGRNIFETYPAASLGMCDIPNKLYKSNGNAPTVRQAILKKLGITDCELTHDELDAIICSLTCVADGDDLLEGEELREEMLRRLNEPDSNRYQIPKGYRLLRRVPSYKSIQIARRPIRDWLNSVSA